MVSLPTQSMAKMDLGSEMCEPFGQEITCHHTFSSLTRTIEQCLLVYSSCTWEAPTTCVYNEHYQLKVKFSSYFLRQEKELVHKIWRQLI